MITKKCTKCEQELPATTEFFYKYNRSKGGLRSKCKACHRTYREQNKEKIAKYKKTYYEQNKEKYSKRGKTYYEQNKEKISKRNKTYYEQNKEKEAKREKIYREQNKEKISKRKKAYREERKKQEPGCVYQILNKKNGKIYIGETIRGKLRWIQHLSYLRGKYHRNHKLQEDYDKFGEKVFEWSVLKELPKDKDTLLLEEIKMIDKLMKEGEDLYNLTLTVDQLQMLQEDK
jgi:hypothetical protein